MIIMFYREGNLKLLTQELLYSSLYQTRGFLFEWQTFLKLDNIKIGFHLEASVKTLCRPVLVIPGCLAFMLLILTWSLVFIWLVGNVYCDK